MLNQCVIADINIAAVCDMDGVTCRALRNLGASTEHPFITVNNKEVSNHFRYASFIEMF